MFLVSSVTTWPDRSQGKNARVFPVNSVRMFPSRRVRMFLARSVRMFPANSASRFLSRFVRLLSLPMEENRKRAFSNRVQSRITSVKTNPQVTPQLPPTLQMLKIETIPSYLVNLQHYLLLLKNHIYFYSINILMQ